MFDLELIRKEKIFMAKIRIFALVVCFNPVPETLDLCLASVTKQLDKTFIFDNGPSGKNEIQLLVPKYPNTVYIKNKENDGLPKNYNRLLFCPNIQPTDWILILDQDSICPNNLISVFWDNLERLSNPNIGILYPRIHYRNLQTEEDLSNKSDPEQVKTGISSGSLINVGISRKIGGFNEDFFIDYVDFEFAYRMERAGFLQYRIPSLALSHDLGNVKMISFCGKKVWLYDKPIIRFYYIFRNRRVFIRNEKTSFQKIKDILSFKLWVRLSIKYYSGDKRKLKKAFSVAVKDARYHRMGAISDESRKEIS
jgi:rhamnosyltransferase